MDFQTIDTDLVVLGSGIAGLRAAIQFDLMSKGRYEVCVLSKVQVMRSHSVAPEGGAAAVMGKGDSYEQHAYDTIKGSDYLADQDVVEQFVREAPNEILQLDHWGMPWARDRDGNLEARAFGAHETPRTYYAYDRTGFFLMKTLYDKLLGGNKVRIFHEFFAVGIIVSDGRFRGIVTIERRTGNFVFFKGKALIIATGGLGRIYSYATYSHTVTGDGHAIAYRAGLPLKDMEFIQWLPTTLVPYGIPATEALRGHGALLLNSEGERFMKKYAPNKMELAARDIVVRAIYTELASGRGVKGPRETNSVLLDARPVGSEKLKGIYKTFRENCINFLKKDPIEELIPVIPAPHYSMGGIHVQSMSMDTTIVGVYSAGEVACLSLHGANRLGSNSIPACLVTGKWAGKSAYEYISRIWQESSTNDYIQEVNSQVNRSYRYIKNETGSFNVFELRNRVYDVADNYLGVFREESRLNLAISEIRKIKRDLNDLKVSDSSIEYNLEWVNVHELYNIVELAEVVAVSALRRKESRGAHYRTDYPHRNDNEFLSHTIVQFDPAALRVSSLPVKITNWAPKEREY